MGRKDDIALPLVHSQKLDTPLSSQSSRPTVAQCLCVAVILALGGAASVSTSGFTHCGHSDPSTSSLGDIPSIRNDIPGLSKDFQRTWAAYSPYFAVEEYEAPPEACRIVQVHLLQRHGARYPTAKNTRKIRAPLQKLVDASSYSDKTFEFLGDFEWDLGEASLVPLGEKEAFEAGSEHYRRYRHLFETVGDLPFVRASGSERVVDSATNWTAGFAYASGGIHVPKVAVIIPEGHGSNNTLDESTCPNFTPQHDQANTWRDIFASPIAARLNLAVPGAHITAKDVVHLMPLCAFESISHGTASPFCALFTLEEFLAYEYFVDVKKFYKTGYGNPLGPIHGIGYTNELLARLTRTPVRDATQTNTTLDASPVTFPLDRAFYVDMAHSNQMIAIYSALGLFSSSSPEEEEGAPDPVEPDVERRWRVSRMVPFSGRLVVEKMRCGRGGGGRKQGEYVRVLVNDAVQPLVACGADEDGLCEMGAFVESQGYARSNGNGDWERCFV